MLRRNIRISQSFFSFCRVRKSSWYFVNILYGNNIKDKRQIPRSWFEIVTRRRRARNCGKSVYITWFINSWSLFSEHCTFKRTYVDNYLDCELWIVWRQTLCVLLPLWPRCLWLVWSPTYQVSKKADKPISYIVDRNLLFLLSTKWYGNIICEQ